MADTKWMVEGVDRAFGVELAPPHHWLRQGEWTSYWVGPKQWLVAHSEPRADYEAQRDAVIGAGGALFDMSDAYDVIALDGEALAKGTGVDLDAKVFAPGECRATLFARIAVLVARQEDSSFTLFVPRSYAESLRGWLGVRP